MFSIPPLEQINTPHGRYYKTPSGLLYPSVTSVLGCQPKPELDAWVKSIGQAEADRITKRAGDRGTLIHSACENHILGNEVNIANPFDKQTYLSLVPFLNRITDVQCLETRLFSNHLRSAGTVDCIGRWDNVMSIIDFKTSGRLKYRDEIHSYFKQCSAYSVMFEELTRIPVSQLVIIMAVDFDTPKIFVEKRDNWIKKYSETRAIYKLLTGI